MRKKILALGVVFTCLETSLYAGLTPLLDQDSRARPHAGHLGMVVAEEPTAAAWGAEVLRQGGNAVDAAVATAFMLSVTRPNSGSLGGGGFMLYCPSPKNKKIQDCVVLDYREQAPSRAHSKMYLGADGKANGDLSSTGALSIGVPGVVAGVLTAHEKFGKLSRSKLLKGPIEQARKGIRFTSYLERSAQERKDDFNATAKKMFQGKRVGDWIQQPDLAKVLEAIQKDGKKGFYQGWVAQKIVSDIQKSKGILSLEDLKNYNIWLRAPLLGSYSGYQIVTTPPPSAGGAMILQLFKYMELADQKKQLSSEYGSAKSIHALAHALSLSFADRAEWFGDPDFTQTPLEQLLNTSYLEERWKKTFEPKEANTPKGAGLLGKESDHTTHFSVIDQEGNAVAVTTTINENYGSAFIPEGTGIFMNDEMDDFSIEPGKANIFGLVGKEANSVQPGKRPLSSMNPTIVRDQDGQNRIVLGAAGGPRITSTVFQILFNRLRYGMSLPDAMHAGRIHHQWKPDVLKLEKNLFSPEVIEQLGKMGYKLEVVQELAHAHALERDPVTGVVWGSADPRGEGDSVPQ